MCVSALSYRSHELQSAPFSRTGQLRGGARKLTKGEICLIIGMAVTAVLTAAFVAVSIFCGIYSTKNPFCTWAEELRSGSISGASLSFIGFILCTIFFIGKRHGWHHFRSNNGYGHYPPYRPPQVLIFRPR